MRLLILACAIAALLLPVPAQAIPATPPPPAVSCGPSLTIISWGHSSGDTHTLWRSRWNPGTNRWSFWIPRTPIINSTSHGYYEAVATIPTKWAVTTQLSGEESYRSEPVYCGPAQPYPTRGVYDRDTTAQVGDGYNLIDSSYEPSVVNSIGTAGGKAMVWLGGYSNTTCTWARSDSTITSQVTALASNTNVGAYFVDDEPDVDLCPDFPSELEDRQNLIKSIDPEPSTFIVTYHTAAHAAGYPGGEHTDQLDDLVGKVDVIALDWYPCNQKDGCDYSRIDREAAAMETACANASVAPCRYWIVPEAFNGSFYSAEFPCYYQYSATTLTEQFKRIRATNAEGYVVYGWTRTYAGCGSHLRDNSTARAALVSENAR